MSFIINPVLRQARRFSEISRSTFSGDEVPPRPSAAQPSATAVDDGSNDRIGDAGSESAVSPPPTFEARPIIIQARETATIETAELVPSAVVLEEVILDQLGFPSAPRKVRGIPEDDGMGELRRRIQDINRQDISSSEKGKLLHEALLEGYRASQNVPCNTADISVSEPTPSPREQAKSAGPLDSLRFWQCDDSTATKFLLSPSDLAPTYAPIRPSKSPGTATPTRSPTTTSPVTPPLGCQHYERNVKLECSTCLKWYTCRFCHDAREDHSLIRKHTRHMLCMLCGTPQKASDVCVGCGEIAAQYYCDVCKLWENRQSKPIYHCSDCGICRRGLGLGKDFFHCKTCRACITTSIQSSHRCIERSTDCDCPICGDYMFTSPRPVVFMTCGHSIHKNCYDQHMKVSYKCPICNKSLANMETQFRNLEAAIQSQPMPPEFRDTQATILCNDCSGRCTVAYHWLGLRCSICRSYNTVELQIHGKDSDRIQTAENSHHVAEPTAASSQDLNRSSTVPLDPRAAESALSPNMRHPSSHDTELQHFATDQIVESLSPLDLGLDASALFASMDMGFEDDILGFWGGTEEDSYAKSDDQRSLDSGDEDSSGSAPDLDGNEDDDDSDEDGDDGEIVLIGHR